MSGIIKMSEGVLVANVGIRHKNVKFLARTRLDTADRSVLIEATALAALAFNTVRHYNRVTKLENARLVDYFAAKHQCHADSVIHANKHSVLDLALSCGEKDAIGVVLDIGRHAVSLRNHPCNGHVFPILSAGNAYRNARFCIDYALHCNAYA